MSRHRLSRTIAAVPALAVLTFVACKDPRLDKLSENITRDSALRILAADAAPGDSVPHIYRESQYLMNGRMYRVVFYTPTDRKQQTDTLHGGERLEERRLTPLVFVNDTLTGWGWKHWEEVAATINVPVAPLK